MNVEQYLRDKLINCSKVDLRPVDQEFLDKNGVEEFIFRMLMSKKFRKWKVGEEYIQELKESVQHAVKNQIPINTTWFFGGYKLWSLPSSPEADWAELFNIHYILRYAIQIAEVYKPGIVMTYWAANPSIMKRQSNIPEENCLIYHKSFRKLLESFQNYLPNNIKLELRVFEELYKDKKEYHNELESLIKEVENEYESWSPERKEKKERSSLLNIQWQGAEDWSRLTESAKQDKIKSGPIVHDSFCRLSKINQAIRGLGKVDLTANPLPKHNSITIGTTKTSITKFWTGVGILEKKGDSYSDRILSPQQFDKIKDQPHEVVQTDLIPLKNFKEIWVYPEELRFS
ncbi:hypothetical protein KKG41_06335 [Patescibacteria group bacterium]|nr:hypothetical protein [Patescibacteria group bacterium]MBU1890770.1 hypothetical protein [Patescibacteria group bacterium]